MKKIIYLFMALIMIGGVFAYSRSVNDATDTVTYTADIAFNSGIAKAYWAIEDTISGCNLDNVEQTSCGSNCEYSISDGVIRLVAYPPDETGGTAIGNQKSIILSGSGTGCTLTGNFAEAPGTTGLSTPLGTSNSFDLDGVECNTDADGITGNPCNGCVDDSEFPTAVSSWKNQDGIISDLEFPSVVYNWKTQTGC